MTEEQSRVYQIFHNTGACLYRLANDPHFYLILTPRLRTIVIHEF